MTDRDLYQRTFSQVRSAADLRWETVSAKRPKRRKVGRMAAIAAAVCLLAGASALAVSRDWLGLGSLLLPQKELTYMPQPEVGETVTQTVDIISLSGVLESPESQALEQWQAFLDGYDADGAILAQIGNGPTGLEDSPYATFYGVYTREMLDRLEELAGQYDLNLHTDFNLVSPQDLASRVGGAFLGANHQTAWGYIYEDGTFAVDGEAVVEGFGRLSYQLRRSVKGTFNEVQLNITAAEDYRQWPYETAGGRQVLLALGPGKALILGDFSQCFVTVNVLSGSDGGLETAQLEALAESIDFEVLQAVRQPEMPGDTPMETAQP